MFETTNFDAIVVGSGISGGWAAKELTERGLKTIVLEAGPPIDPSKDFVEHVQSYDMHFRGRGDRKALERDYPVQRGCYACDEMGHKFFVKDAENPYTNPDDAPFKWFRGRQVGGRSITWGRQVYRWSDLDFGANAKDGHGTDWPIRYADIAPWYSYVEKFIGITGANEGLSQLPDGEFLPAMPMTCVGARRAAENSQGIRRRARDDHRPRGDSHEESQRPARVPLLRSVRARDASRTRTSIASAPRSPRRARRATSRCDRTASSPKCSSTRSAAARAACA